MEESQENSQDVYKLSQNNAPERKTKTTDPIFKYIFIVLFISWIVSTCYLLFSYEMKEFTFLTIWFERFFENGFSSATLIIFLTIISTLLFLTMISHVPKFCTYVIVFLFAIYILLYIVCIVKLILSGSVDNIGLNIFIILVSIFCTIYFGIVFFCIKRVGVSAIADIVAKTSKGFFPNLYMILLVIIIIILKILIGFLVLRTSYSFIYAAEVPDYNYLSILINATVGGVYVFNFISFYGRMIISPVIATWYRAGNKPEIPKTLIFEKAATIEKYHFGTVALAALPLVPFFMTIAAIFNHKIITAQSKLDFCSRLLLSLNLIFGNTEYSTVLSSIHGQSYNQSTKNALMLLTKNSPLTLAYIEISRGISSLKIGFSILWAVLAVYSFTDTYNIEYNIYGLIAVGMVFAMIILWPVLMLLDFVSQAILVCILEDDEKANPLKENA